VSLGTAIVLGEIHGPLGTPTILHLWGCLRLPRGVCLGLPCGEGG